MLAIVEPDGLDEVLAICEKWDVRASVIGRVTPGPATGDADGGRLRILDGWDGEVLADVPAASLHEDAPLYDRPLAGARPTGTRPRRTLGRAGRCRTTDDPAPTCSTCSPTPRGCGRSTTTSSSSTPSRARAATPPCCG